jgi:hypothetical protein
MHPDDRLSSKPPGIAIWQLQSLTTHMPYVIVPTKHKSGLSWNAALLSTVTGCYDLAFCLAAASAAGPDNSFLQHVFLLLLFARLLSAVALPRKQLWTPTPWTARSLRFRSPLLIQKSCDQ